MTSETPTAGRKRINWRIAGWGIVATALLLPLAAMQLTDEVNWTASDFVFAALLIGGAGLALELAVRWTGNRYYRAATGLAVAAAFLTIWSNGAVGIIGSENNDANDLFNLVPLLAAIGSALVWFRTMGLARVMLGIAIIQVLVTIAVLAMGWGERTQIWPREVFYSAGGFGGLWLASAWLFSRAARDRPSAR